MLLAFEDVENDEAVVALPAVYLTLLDDDGILLLALSVRWSVDRTVFEDMAVTSELQVG